MAEPVHPEEFTVIKSRQVVDVDLTSLKRENIKRAMKTSSSRFAAKPTALVQCLRAIPGGGKLSRGLEADTRLEILALPLPVNVDKLCPQLPCVYLLCEMGWQ